MHFYFLGVAKPDIYGIVMVCEAIGHAKETRPVKRFLELLAWITAHLSEDAVERVVEAVRLAYDDGYQAGRDGEAKASVASRPLGIDWAPVLSHLNAYPSEKIAAIKEIRSQTGLGLRESKDLCDAVMPFLAPRW
jgi:ribosomal protein L7/L12